MAENNRNADSVSRGIANQGIEQGGRIGLAFVDTDEPLIARGKLDTYILYKSPSQRSKRQSRMT